MSEPTTATEPSAPTPKSDGGQAGDLCRRILAVHDRVSTASTDLNRLFAQTAIELSGLLADGYQLHHKTLTAGFDDAAFQLHHMLVALSNVQIDVSTVTDTAAKLPTLTKAFAHERHIDLNATPPDEPAP
ncbi:hypothetical protein [Stackebrandtia nassauensis]|uniref:Uncharacterized protein n=1 Tax=Stackebrandtia nassauensis (strain DSM 44728 / CIP 108903 / NRRL B-16338 / NBRC 102104 / LLR-40K-21) TaxID=446470 RepID=D3PVT0_STANL|nr:hypothetical protein [Stackebrandtia nassauensis]ADD45051.1 hypothetical protein Snas_5419 [Stackebrandtia nassauensis DSM 44728]